MLRELEEKVKTIMNVLRKKWGVVTIAVAVATAKVFIARRQNKHLKCIDLDS